MPSPSSSTPAPDSAATSKGTNAPLKEAPPQSAPVAEDAEDEVVTTIQRVVLDLDGPRVVRLKLPADQHRSSLCDDVKCRGSEWADVQWAAEGSQLAFVSTSRDHREEVFRIASATTGEVRDVMKEVVPTFFESGNGRVNWNYLAASK